MQSNIVWKTAWKNVWRNRIRSIVVISSVTIGVFAGVFSLAFMNGMIAQRVNAALDEEISHIQVSGKGFRLNNDPEITVPDLPNTINRIIKIEGVAGIVKRSVVSGMAATATKSAGVQIMGIDPEEEKKIFKLNKTIMQGTGDYFEKESKYNLALIGQDLAKELNIIRYSIDSLVIGKLREQKVPEATLKKLKPVIGTRFQNEKKFTKSVNSLLSKKEIKKYGPEIKKTAWSFREGSRFTLTFLDRDNNQVGAVFRLTGIYDLKNTIFEQSTIFVKDADLKRFTGADAGLYNQIIIRLNDKEQTDRSTTSLREEFPYLEITNWKEMQPDLAMMTDYVQEIYLIFMVIILAALAFGIVNTMLMVVLERTRELGMLTAIGMNKKKVFSMIMLESVFLSIIGGIAGMGLGYVVIILTAKNGINFVQYAEGMEAFGYSAHVYPEIGTGFFVMVAILVVITGIVSSVYPALKALKLNPVEAIRAE